MPDDFRVSITDAPGKNTYPISSFTWLLVPTRIQDAGKRQAITDFIRWMLADGQKFAEPLAYARLPKEVVSKEMKAISRFNNMASSAVAVERFSPREPLGRAGAFLRRLRSGDEIAHLITLISRRAFCWSWSGWSMSST